MAETLFVEHLAGCWLGHRHSNMLVEGSCTGSHLSDSGKVGHLMSSLFLCHSYCFLLSGASLQLFQLHKHVRTIVTWLSHSLIEIIQCGVGHFKRLVRDGSYSSEIRLVALVFQYSFLSKLNSMFFFKFAD